MSGLVLDLQKELLNSNCNVLDALRKAHLIASKLKLNEFDKWIQSELNGYSESQDEIPEYRQVTGSIKALNPSRGWIPVFFDNSEYEKNLCTTKLDVSIGDIIELYESSETNHFTMRYNADISKILNSGTSAPFSTNYNLYVSTHLLKSIIEKVKNCLLEWTLKLESEGISGENMTFNSDEALSARAIPQQINNYYGTVVNGDVSKSQVVSGNENTISFSYEKADELIESIKSSIETDDITEEDKENANELVNEIAEKISNKKSPKIIKVALSTLKDFLISTGANVTAAIITSAMQGQF